MRRLAKLLAFAWPCLCVALIACDDRDQAARRTGEAARAAAANVCRDKDPLERGDCAEEACKPACRAYADARIFEKTCIAACVASGECATDADCNDGLRCEAIAPRVRRCAPRADAAP